MTFSTSQEEARRKELLKQYEKATNQYAPTIDYLKKSPSYLRIGLPACISKKI